MAGFEAKVKAIDFNKKYNKLSVAALVCLLLGGGIGFGIHYQLKVNDEQLAQINSVSEEVKKVSEINSNLREEKESLTNEKINLTNEKNGLLKNQKQNEEKLKEADGKIKNLNKQVEGYKKDIDTIKQQANSAAEGDPTTFRVVQGGTPIYPLRFFRGVGQVIDENGNPVSD